MDKSRGDARRSARLCPERDAHFRPRRSRHADAAPRGAGAALGSRRREALSHAHQGPAPFAGAEHRDRFFSTSLFVGAPLRRCDRRRTSRLHPDLSLRHPLVVRVRTAACSTWRCCSCRRRIGTATARSAPRSTPRLRPRTRLGISSRRSTSRCRGRSATRSSRSIGFTRSSIPTARSTRSTPVRPTPVDDAIGEHVAALVPDGATLQMGIGAIPDAALRRLSGKHKLGDPHGDVLGRSRRSDRGRRRHQRTQERPSRTDRHRVSWPGRAACSTSCTTTPSIEFHPCDRTNDTALIRQNPQVVRDQLRA